MRALPILLGAVAATWMLGVDPSFARVEGPWCFHMTLGRDSVTSRCDLPSYEACRAEMRSLGGTYCTQNPYYWWNVGPDQPRKVKRRAKRQR